MEVKISNYTCHSGGSAGADIIWEVVGDEFYVKTISYSYKGHKQLGKNPYIMNTEELLEGWENIKIAEKSLRRNLTNIEFNPYVRNLLCRNWFQVKNSEAVFAVGMFTTTAMKEVQGGTGWAVQMGIDNKKPVYVFEQDREFWFQYSYETNSFNKYEGIPTLTENFAGIGTRGINDSGTQAIIDIYENTFKDG